jgi:hypothetical protein
MLRDYRLPTLSDVAARSLGAGREPADAEKGARRGVRDRLGEAVTTFLLAAAITAGAPDAAVAVTAGLTYQTVATRGGSDFPEDLYNDFPDEEIYAIAWCGPCGESEFDLFDGALGALRSVRITYDGSFWGDAYDYSTGFGGYYRDMSMYIGANGYGGGIRNLLSDDWRDLDFSGEIVVSDASVPQFVNAGRGPGLVDFSGRPQMYFATIEETGFGSMGASYTVTVEYGYEPVVASVPLPPAALFLLGGLGALFAASRRRSGSAA